MYKKILMMKIARVHITFTKQCLKKWLTAETHNQNQDYFQHFLIDILANSVKVFSLFSYNIKTLLC